MSDKTPRTADDALGGSFVAKGYEAFVSKEATDDSLAGVHGGQSV